MAKDTKFVKEIIEAPEAPEKPEAPELKKELTPDERALASRMADTDRSWETIKEEEMNDFSLSEFPYKLPKEAAEKQAAREFAFRWAEAKPGNIDLLKSLEPPARWWVCNATNTPFLSKYVDPAHGGVQKLDQVLMFKPWWMHEKHQNAKMELGRAKDADIHKLNGKKEEWGEWKAGQEYKIGSNDQVMAEDAGEEMAAV